MVVMFVRTQRLTLRPGWIEDAPELARAIGHWDVISKLARAPWPYATADAEAFLRIPAGRPGSSFLICDLHEGESRIVGGIGVDADERGGDELGYWLTPEVWGRGYATEAASAVVRTMRDSLRLKRLVSGHFIDNPASGRVLRKIGFRPTGRIEQRFSRARGDHAACATFELDLCGGEIDGDPRTKMAA